MKKVLGALAISMLAVSVLRAASDDAGTGSAVFLRDGQGARALGMGGAAAASSRGSSAMFWNPGGLSLTEERDATLSHNTLIEDVNTQSLAVCLPSAAGTFGVSAVMMNAGTIEKRNSAGTLLGDADVKGAAYSLAFGRKLGERWGFGVNAKMVEEDLVVETGKATAFDAGVAWDGGVWSAGAAFQNFGGKFKAGDAENDLSSVVRGGVAYHPREHESAYMARMLLAADLEKATDQDLKARGGVEYILNRMLTMRAGYEQGDDAAGGLSFGLGIWTDFKKIEGEPDPDMDFRRRTESKMKLEVDYAYLMRDVFDDLHRVSLTFKF